ncbi:hypothetical protein [Lysinibacillus sp. fls2-241-R2A-57]|uniref:hypothetical protein n=1 Tax=Lysinibacillus sp. fls2-241-R2A-57 TaxID=3040292 RepID=UPI0025563003|nr:hypothetical protein [Lysinibacillus sp. fls2-241-R2A-57]
MKLYVLYMLIFVRSDWTPPGSFALCESEATATTTVLSVRKQSVSNKWFICAKAKRQQQLFYLRESIATATIVLSVRKQSDSNKCFICAKAKRQQQLFYLCESEASATNVFCSESKATATNVFCSESKAAAAKA